MQSKIHTKLYSLLSVSIVQYPQIQPTMDLVVCIEKNLHINGPLQQFDPMFKDQLHLFAAHSVKRYVRELPLNWKEQVAI